MAENDWAAFDYKIADALVRPSEDLAARQFLSDGGVNKESGRPGFGIRMFSLKRVSHGVIAEAMNRRASHQLDGVEMADSLALGDDDPAVSLGDLLALVHLYVGWQTPNDDVALAERAFGVLRVVGDWSWHILSCFCDSEFKTLCHGV
jgi:hypothetical protein